MVFRRHPGLKWSIKSEPQKVVPGCPYKLKVGTKSSFRAQSFNNCKTNASMWSTGAERGAAAPSQSRSGDHRFNSYDLSHSSFFSNCVSQSVSHSAARSPGTKKKLATWVFALFLFTKKKNIRTTIWRWRAHRTGQFRKLNQLNNNKIYVFFEYFFKVSYQSLHFLR